MTLADLGYEEGLPAVLGDWLVKIDEIVRDAEADRDAQNARGAAAGVIGQALGAS